MRLTIIGAGTPTPAAERFGSAYVVDIGPERLLFDCGPATTHKLARAGIDVRDIHRLFFTHHHFDHNADYPCFLLSRWDQGGDEVERLRVWGPRPTDEITKRLIGEEGAYVDDWRARVMHPASQKTHANRGGTIPRRPPAAEVVEVEVGDQIDGDGWTVKVGPAWHVQPYLESVAYRLEADGRSIVFAGDTEPRPEVAAFAAECDVFVYMAWGDHETLAQTGEVGGVSSTRDAATMAGEAGAKQLLVVHLGDSVRPLERQRAAVEDMQRFYSGKITFADELESIDIGSIIHQAARESGA